jgi:hypothetical protein
MRHTSRGVAGSRGEPVTMVSTGPEGGKRGSRSSPPTPLGPTSIFPSKKKKKKLDLVLVLLVDNYIFWPKSKYARHYTRQAAGKDTFTILLTIIFL